MKIGSPASDFTLTDHHGSPWHLSEQQGKAVLLLFYPANETLVCTKQLCSLRDNWSKYLDTGAEIVAISSSGEEANAEFAEKFRLPLPLLSDPGNKVTTRYAAHSFFPLSFMRAVTVIDASSIVRTHQSMLRAFRPDDNDIIRNLYAARSSVFESEQKELSNRIKKLILDF
jgi:peroxiredoxin Q/BCP